MKVRASVLGALAIAALPLGAADATLPTATTFGGIPQVGALFLPGGTHYCSAAVVASRHRDLVLTAAHCVAGTGLGITFAPGYSAGRAPYGIWSVTNIYVSPGWLISQDPHRDYAFLRVAPRAGRELQSVVGGFPLGYSPRPGRRVTVMGYPVGQGGSPLRCTVPVRYTLGYPRVDCHGFVGGTSGGPFVRYTRFGPRLAGLIGGLHQGGCTEVTSYSPYFGPALFALRDRADDNGLSDVVPPAGPDGC